MEDNLERTSINRRTVLKSAAAASAIGLVGFPAFTGSAIAATASMTVRSGTSTKVVGYRVGSDAGAFPTSTPNVAADLTWVPSAWDGTDHDFDDDTRWIWHCDESSETGQTTADVTQYNTSDTDPTYYVLEPVDGDVVEFEETFSIPGTPTSATLYITADNGYEAMVNGSYVTGDTVNDYDGTEWEDSDLTDPFVTARSGSWDTVESANVLSELSAGSNTLTVRGANEYADADDENDSAKGTVQSNPGGVIYELDIEYETCMDCSGDFLEKYEFGCVERDPDTGDCVDWDFVLEGEDDPNISYTPGSFTSKDDEEYEPMSVTFETSYCDLYVLVKSGQELEVQSFEDIDGSFTVDTANGEKYAISFVAIYCDESAALAAKEDFPSNGKGRGK